jgi:hypothetical protein
MSANAQTNGIYDVDVDHFDCSKDSLATTGINPCICFVVILNKGEHVFIEHRSDIYLPINITSENTELYLKNVAQHIHKMTPKSSVT